MRGGYEADLRHLMNNGVTLVGSLSDIDGTQLSFAPNLVENVTKGDAGIEQFIRSADAYVVEHGLAMPEESRPTTVPIVIPSLIDRLDMQTAGITSVIWATGYTYDFGWVECPVFDERGAPIHQRGVTSVPGLYFLGLRYLSKVKSTFLRGVGEDAEYLAKRIGMGTSDL